MSQCPIKKGCSSKRYSSSNDEDCPYTNTCKASCPGGKKACPGGRNCTSGKACPVVKPCPVPNTQNCPPFSKEGEQCITDCVKITQPQVSKYSSCTAPPGCSGPIVINAPTDSCNPRTDLRIELFIHQLPSDQTEGGQSCIKNEENCQGNGPETRGGKSKEAIQGAVTNGENRITEMGSENAPSSAAGNEPRTSLRGDDGAALTSGNNVKDAPAVQNDGNASTVGYGELIPSGGRANTSMVGVIEEGNVSVKQVNNLESAPPTAGRMVNAGTNTQEDDDVEFIAGGRLVNRGTQYQ